MTGRALAVVMMVTVCLLFGRSVDALPAGPSPDPDPSACQGGWCRVPTVSDWWTAPMRLKGHPGLWRCHVTARPTMKCVRVQP